MAPLRHQSDGKKEISDRPRQQHPSIRLSDHITGKEGRWAEKPPCRKTGISENGHPAGRAWRRPATLRTKRFLRILDLGTPFQKFRHVSGAAPSLGRGI